MKKLEFLLKHSRVLQTIYRVFFSCIFRMIGSFVRTQDIILFSSFSGKRYNDSPKVLYEAMRKDSSFFDYRMIWAFEDPSLFPEIPDCDKVGINTFGYFLTALRASIWVTSVNIERGLSFKKKETLYVNTWHGAGTKRIGNACAGRNDYDFSSVNVLLVQSEFEKEIFERDFNASRNSMLKCGFPRNDELFHLDKIDKNYLRNIFGVPEGKKVILYAPTWRDSIDGGESYPFTPPINMPKWEMVLKSDYVLMVRMHAFTTQCASIVYDDFVRDASNVGDLNHLLAITDVLITDYSTIVFDSAAARIPFLCFGFDYDEYSEARGFYFDLRLEYPYGVQKDENQILQLIPSLNFDQSYEAFAMKYIEAGGNATNMVISEIKERKNVS